MIRIRILSFVAACVAFATTGHAQMSTFPAPPPLAPPSDVRNADASTLAVPSPDQDPTLTGKSTRESSPGATTNTTNPTPPTPAVSAATLTSMSALDDKVALAEGDTVSFRVIEDRDDPVSRIVTDTGEVDFPYIGRVKVEGKTCHEVAIEVKKLLEVDYYKRATVIVGLDLIQGEDKTKPKDMAWVMGEVKEVGPLELLKAQPMTVSQLIMRAGGFGDFADQRKVKVIRRTSGTPESSDATPDLTNSKNFQIVDVKSVFDGKSSVDPVVSAGDYIIVPKKFVNFGM